MDAKKNNTNSPQASARKKAVSSPRRSSRKRGANSLRRSGKKVVSRAENKLAEAASAFSFDFRKKIVVDVGSSTGGFTEYAIRHGAMLVIAIEQGTNQMKAPLRYNDKVWLMEKTDIFRVESLMYRPDVILADVSFVSLRSVLKHLKKLVGGGEMDFLVMLKPQFEVYPDELWEGIVKNERIRRSITKGFERWLKTQGFLIVNKHDNKTTGRHGNRERFYWLKLTDESNSGN